MATSLSLLGTALRVAPALFILGFAPTVALNAAVGDNNEEHPFTIYAAENCPVCGKDMSKSQDKKSVKVDGRNIECYSGKCADEIKAKPEYYKGVYDGVGKEKERNSKSK